MPSYCSPFQPWRARSKCSIPTSVTRFAGILIAERGNMAETRRKNDELIALAAKYPEMFPIASVHPYDDQAALEEVRRIAGLGVTLIKLHPHTQKFSITDPRVAALCQLAGQLGMIVLFDNANIVPGDSQDLFNLAASAASMIVPKNVRPRRFGESLRERIRHRAVRAVGIAHILEQVAARPPRPVEAASITTQRPRRVGALGLVA